MYKLSFKDDLHPELTLESSRYTVGRDASNDITLSDDRVSGFHAEFHQEQNKVYLVDLGSRNGTLINGQMVLGRTELNAWDKILLGDTEIEVIDPAGRRPTVVGKAISEADIAAFQSQQSIASTQSANATQVRPAASTAPTKTSVNPAIQPNKTQVMPALAPVLTIKSGVLAGKKTTLDKQEYRIGRDDSNDIVLSDSTVSSFHARLNKQGNDWRLEDNQSTNGSYINNEKVTGKTLKSGDKLRLGKIELSYALPEVNSTGSANKTQVMSSITPDLTSAPKTSQQPEVPKKKKVPNWLWGVASFVVIAAGAGTYMMRDQLPGVSPAQISAPLQIGKVWQQPLENNRNAPVTPVLADVNGDDYLDVVIADGSGHVTAYDGLTGKLIFDADISGKVLAPLATGDITGNGFYDIIVPGYSGVVTALNGRGQVLWQTGSKEAFGRIINRPTLANVNDNGVNDVIVPTLDKGVVALDGLRGWRLWDTSEMTKGQAVTTPLVTDLNGDGVLNVLSVSDAGQALAVSTQNGNLWKLWENNDIPPVLYSSPALLNVGKEKLIAIATRDSGVVTLRAENGRPAWQAKINKPFFGSPLVLDANGNGSDDIALVAKNGDIHILDGRNGDELWSTALGVPVSATPALFDVNDDGLNDLIILDEKGGLHIVNMARGRTELFAQLSNSSGFIASPVLGDINNDKLLGIVTASQDGELTSSAINRVVRKGTAPWPVFLGHNDVVK